MKQHSDLAGIPLPSAPINTPASERFTQWPLEAAAEDSSPARRRKRVIFVNRFFYPDVSASSQMLSDLAFELARSGMAVHVISSRLLYEEGLAPPSKQETVKGVIVHRVWTSRFGRHTLLGRGIDYLTFFCTMSLAGLKLARSGDILVAKTDPPLISVFCLLVAKIRSATLVNWIQDLFPEVAAAAGLGIARGPVGYLLRCLRDVSLRQAASNIAIGEGMRKKLTAMRFESELIKVIPNWADGDAIGPVARDANELRSQWGLQGQFVVGYSGNLGFAHDYETILESAYRLRADNRVCFLFIGGGKHTPVLQKEAQRRGMRNIIFKPYQPRAILRYSLSVADIHVVSLVPALEGYVVPSKFYGVAAAGRGTLNIGAADGEIARLLEKSGCGVTVRPGDSKRVVELVLEWLERPEIPVAMGIRARALHDTVLSHRFMIDRWRQVMDTVSSPHPVIGEQVQGAK